jgi:hypothetical protein
LGCSKTLLTAQFTQRRKKERVNDEVERTWKETIMASFKVLSQHFSGGIEENQDIFNQRRRSLGQDSNQGSPKYETGILATRPLLLQLSGIRPPWLVSSTELNVRVLVLWIFVRTP